MKEKEFKFIERNRIQLGSHWYIREDWFEEFIKLLDEEIVAYCGIPHILRKKLKELAGYIIVKDVIN